MKSLTLASYFKSTSKTRAWAAAFAGLLAVLTSGSAYSSQYTCESLFVSDLENPRAFEASTSVSQHIRDNTPDFWDTCKEQGQDYFGDLSAYQGLVVGDAHAGNFIRSILNGKLEFFIADIKDAGQAPFIYDLARLVVATQATLKRNEAFHMSTSDTASSLLQSYMAGLRGEPLAPRSSIAWIFDVTEAKYEKMQAKYVGKKVAEDRFKMKDGSVEPMTAASTGLRRKKIERMKEDMTKALLKAYPRATVLDFAARPRERGGSAFLTRYWALARVKGQLKIIEFKEIGAPATEAFADQQDTGPRYKKVIGTFWGQSDPSYAVVALDDQAFWMRPKKIDIFSVPYKQKTVEDGQFLLDLAMYDAQYMGLLHARQLSSGAYLQALSSKVPSTVSALTGFSKMYRKHLKDVVSEAEKSDANSGED